MMEHGAMEPAQIIDHTANDQEIGLAQPGKSS